MTFRSFLNDESGATMVEYGLMVALIAVVCIVAVELLGTTLNEKFEEINERLGAAGEEDPAG